MVNAKPPAKTSRATSANKPHTPSVASASARKPGAHKAGARTASATQKKAAPEKRRRSAVAAVVPRADPKRKARFEALSRVIADAKKSNAKQFDALYEAIGEVLERELFLEGGYRSSGDYIAKVLNEPARTVLRNVRVAKYATAAEQVRYGIAKLDAALSFIEAKMGGSATGRLPVRFDALEIPAERDGVHTMLSLEEATVAHIHAASKDLLTQQVQRNDRRSAVERSIARALAKFASLAQVTVRVQQGKVRLGEFALEALPTLAEALASVKLAPSRTAH
jgi:hypothetical protein